MKLQPEPEQLGLWQNEDWKPGEPGLFAVLIGVSEYPYLKEGSAKKTAKENYGLGQLAVSALTAYRLFEWLQDQYLFSDQTGVPCKVAKCWLLLSPTAEEKIRIGDSVIKHALAPTFENFSNVIKYWYDTMEQLEPANAQHSRAVFFFSGHGLEVSMEEQILLPMDYLEPVLGTLNRAINIMAARPALKTLPIKDQFFFLDACRNDLAALRQKEVHGDGVLDKPLANQANPDCNQMVMYATASGLKTYGPRSADKGISLFGQSLLWGLRAERDFKLDRSQLPLSIQWSPLHQFVKNAYNDLLIKYKSPEKQKVKVAGEYDDSFAVVTHVDLDFIDINDDDTNYTDIYSWEEKPQKSLATIKYTLPKWLPFGDIYNSLNKSVTDFFGYETVTDIWYKARLFQLDSINPVNRDLLFGEIEHSGTRKKNQPFKPFSDAYRITFTISEPGLYWLQINDSSSHLGCILPYNSEGPRPIFQANFVYHEPTEFTHQLTGFEVNLSSNSELTLGDTAKLWRQYEKYGAVEAVKQMNSSPLIELVYSKRKDPLSALIASIILMRLGRSDDLPQAWLNNLLNWFPVYADTPILLNEYLDRTQKLEENKVRNIKGLTQMHERGLPVTGEALGYALRQASLLENELNNELLSQTLDKLKLARKYFIPSGLFTVFTGSEEELHELRSHWKLNQ